MPLSAQAFLALSGKDRKEQPFEHVLSSGFLIQFLTIASLSERRRRLFPSIRITGRYININRSREAKCSFYEASAFLDTINATAFPAAVMTASGKA